MTSRRVAVLLPCYNEAVAISQVVRGFQAALPGAAIYVYDNNSTDTTAKEAAAAGALVRYEPRRGKGNVVRRMFADIDADIYVMADGDATYDPTTAPTMIELLVTQRLDMVVGKRQANDEAAYRAGHRFGNHALTQFVARLLGGAFSDIFSGYRVFSRRYVKSFPALAKGFEIESELTIHALELGLPVAEITTPYLARPHGSASKLSTYTDGGRILMSIVRLYKDVQPFRFFGALGAALMLVALGLAWPLLMTYLETGLVPRFPTAILATGIGVLSCLSAVSGVILDSVARGRLEAKRLAYLRYEPVSDDRPPSP
jgi:glycosyltransferase involved in cell wall biosynthesis